MSIQAHMFLQISFLLPVTVLTLSTNLQLYYLMSIKPQDNQTVTVILSHICSGVPNKLNFSVSCKSSYSS